MDNKMKERFDEMFHKSHDKNYPFDCWEAFDGLRADFLQFIKSEIDLAVAKREKEIVERIKEYWGYITNDGVTGKPMNLGQDEVCKDIIDLIKTK